MTTSMKGGDRTRRKQKVQHSDDTSTSASKMIVFILSMLIIVNSCNLVSGQSEQDEWLMREIQTQFSLNSDAAEGTRRLLETLQQNPSAMDASTKPAPLPDCRPGELSTAACNATRQCLKADAVLDEVSSAEGLVSACPRLLYQAVNGPALCNQSRSPDPEQETGRDKPSNWEKWGIGLACVLVISISSMGGAAIFPYVKESFYKKFITALIGLAVGSLSGSAIFHLLPQAFDLLTAGHGYAYKSLTCMGGIYLFFLTDHLLHYIQFRSRCKKRKQAEEAYGVEDVVKQSTGSLVGSGYSQSIELPNGALDGGKIENGLLENGKIEKRKVSSGAVPSACGHSHSHDHLDAALAEGGMTLTTKDGKVVDNVAWMIIIGDGLHNFIDGLGIGAGFTQSTLTGLSISLAVFCEEFPHELGDFAVLIKSGMSLRRAMLFNFLSALTCVAGFIVGVLIASWLETSIFFTFALAGGMFLYIALVNMLPEVNRSIQDAVAAGQGVTTFLLVNVGMMAGVCVMFFTALYASDISLE